MMVTGASGFLGRHLLPASEQGGWELLAPGSAAFDVRSRGLVLEEIRAWKPTVVVHLAYRRDDRRVIVDGSRHVAEAATAAGARLVHLSTDVVFAGREWPYSEADLPDATMDYGRWKAEAEAAVVAACPTAVLVRTSLLYGTEHIAPGQREVADAVAGRRSMRFFTDEYRCPAHAADVAAAVVRLASMPEVRGPLHVAGPQVVSRADLACAFAGWMGLDPSRVPRGTLADAGLDRPGRIALDVSHAAALGLHCRPLETALGR